MNTGTRDFLTGTVSVLGFVVLILLLIQFGELAALRGSTGSFEIRVDSARGISRAAPVTLSGVRVGSVSEVRVNTDPDGGVIVDISYDRTIDIPADFEVFIDAALIGDAKLELVSPENPSGAFIEGGGERYDREINSLVGDLSERIQAPLAAVEDAAEAFVRLSDTYIEVGDRITAMSDRLESSLNEFDATSATVRTELTRLTTTAETTGQQVAVTMRSLDATLDETRAIAAAVNSGTGTLGLLVNNPDLYLSMQSTARQLDAAIIELRLTIEKFRDEGVPVQF